LRVTAGQRPRALEELLLRTEDQEVGPMKRPKRSCYKEDVDGVLATEDRYNRLAFIGWPVSRERRQTVGERVRPHGLPALQMSQDVADAGFDLRALRFQL